MSIKIIDTVQGVRFTQLDSSIQATIQIIIDNSITNNAEASYTSGNLVIRVKSTCNRNHFAAGVNTDVPSDFYARVMSSGTTVVTALSQTNLGQELLQYDTDADLSDLSNCHVVTSTLKDDINTYDTDFRLIVEGTLFHNPEDEVLILRNSSTGNNPASSSLYVSQANNSYGGTNGWRNITGGWTVDSDGYFVINITTTDAWGHTYQVGDAIESRGNSTITGGTQEQRDYIDSIYRHCHRIMAINGNLVTISLQDPYGGDVTISGGQIIRRPIYNYGQEINSGGRARYSSGAGLIIAGTAGTTYHPNQAGISNSNDGMLYFRGGTIMSNRPASFSSNVDMTSTTIIATKSGLQIRALSGWFRDVTFVGWGMSNYTGARTFQASLQNSTLIGVLDDTFRQYSLKNFDVSKNTAVTDIGPDAPNNRGHLALEIINSANGSNVKHMWRTTDNRNSSSQRGAIIIKKEVSINVKNATGNNISDVKVYLQDNPSTRARDSVIADSDGNSYAGTTITVANAEVDTVTGGIKYLYANPLIYSKTTDGNGNVDTFTVTTATQILEYTGTDDSARQANGGPYDIPNYVNGYWRESDNLTPAFSDWDTDRFGGFYKVDRRSNTNTDADDFTFKFGHYNYSLNSSTQQLKGIGELSFEWVLFNDSLISETDKTKVDDYIAITDSDRFYDRAKSYLIDNYAGELSTLVTRSGLTIDAGDKNIVLDPSVTNAASAFAFDSGTNTLTIKCTSFTGNLTTTGTVTLNSGVTVLGTIIDSNNPVGLSSRTFSISNIILGTTIQIYNEDQATKRGTTENYSPANVYETLIASGTTTSSTLIGNGSSTIAQLIAADGTLTADTMADTSYVLPAGWTLTTTYVAGGDNRVTISGIYNEGTAPNGDFDAGDSVRVRATCAASTGAFLPYVNTTIANEGGFSIRVNQQVDTIYNDNGIDGSASNYDTTSLTLTPDYTNLQIDVFDSDSDGVVTVQQVYAKYAYLITTTDGIDKFFGAITAENTSNYRINTDIVDLKIQNISANDTILTGARLYRSDNTTVIQKGYLNNDQNNGPAGTLSHDTGEFLQYIQPQVEAALNGYGVLGPDDLNAVKKNTNLIPGLL